MKTKLSKMHFSITKKVITTLKTPWFSIQKHTVQLPSGVEHDYYIHHAEDSALCVCITEDNKILIEKQYRPAIKKISIDYPAGRMERKDKDISQTMLRELREETGYIASSLKKLAVIDKEPSFSTSRMHIFLVKGIIQDKKNLDPTENIVIDFVEPSRIVAMILSKKISCTFCISATFFAFKEMKLFDFKQ